MKIMGLPVRVREIVVRMMIIMKSCVRVPRTLDLKRKKTQDSTGNLTSNKKQPPPSLRDRQTLLTWPNMCTVTWKIRFRNHPIVKEMKTMKKKMMSWEECSKW
uniref:Uncharacterized protein n=1 Tax=Cacopsylla melanoneura TaxID=428564 RepID=A0A8D8S060_9HEMI